MAVVKDGPERFPAAHLNERAMEVRLLSDYRSATATGEGSPHPADWLDSRRVGRRAMALRSARGNPR
jgi:hypothetical protein